MSKIYNYKSLTKKDVKFGRPTNYPTPSEDNQLFFIQRNLSHNAVVYSVNLTIDGYMNLSNPISIYWLKFDSNKLKTPLNIIQREIAYGYNYEVVCNDLVKFNFVSYKKDFFLTKINEKYCVITKFNEINYIVESFYVHADQFGAFPVINYVEAHLIDMLGKERLVLKMDLNKDC